MALIFLFSGTNMRLIGLLHVLSIFMVHTCLGADHQLHRVALFCSVATNNTGSSTFTINLDGLFNKSLYNKGGNYIYYKTTYHDKDPDEVHGLYLCKGDVTKQTCLDCVVSAIEKLVDECHGTKDAIIWFQECLVRYSNRSFSSSMELKPTASMSKASSLNIMEPVKFKKILYKSFSHLIRNASSSTSKYATRTVNISRSVNLYIFGQCIPDLSKEDCRVCLDNAVQLLDYRKQGSAYFYPSCNARFKLHRFSVDSTVATSLPTSDNETGHADIAPTIVHLSNATKLGKSKEEVIRELIAVGAATLTIIAVVLFVYFLQRKWKKNKRDQVNALNLRRLEEVRIGNEYVYDTLQGQNEIETQEFPLDLILEATRHFSDENKIGEGGFGPVYKGILLDGKEIAVKRLARTSGQGLREFKNEVTLIAKLQHKNLVRLLGCCLEGNELLLIYEYLANKSLDFLLFDATRSVQLDWKMRTSIINGIARGLLYLHEDSRFKVIHRDLKASNILLDHEWNPKISDFGMARTFDDNENETNTSRVVGTYGYMAPEYAMEGLFSVKSDIFSFGVLLLEIISGKKNGGVHLSEYGRSLLNYTWKLWCEGEVLELIDPAIVQSCIPSELLKYTNIGLLCCQENSRDRPTISCVVVMLANENTTLSQPNRPAFSAG